MLMKPGWAMSTCPTKSAGASRLMMTEAISMGGMRARRAACMATPVL